MRATYGYGDQVVFAVLHREWGFVGSVSLILHRGAGFFYYWVGADFQGRGFGPEAVSILLRLARDVYGMRTCYAKVFSGNHRSQRGLSKLGFRPMSVQAALPDDDERFYRLGVDVPEAAANRELQTLLKDMGSELRVRKPVAMVERRRPRHTISVAQAALPLRGTDVAERAGAKACLAETGRKSGKHVAKGVYR